MADQPIFAIQRVYIKDQSYEAPETPAVFGQEAWLPELDFHIQSRHIAIGDDLFEVVLQLTVTARSKETVAFLAEVHQAGIFTLQNFPPEDAHRLIGQICPSILYPYARANISHMISQGSFPGLYLAPIDFQTLYEEQLKQAASMPAEPSEEVH